MLILLRPMMETSLVFVICLYSYLRNIHPKLEELNNRCNIRFTTEIFDTEASERVALNKLVDLTRRDPENEQLPCAILGASRTASTAPMAIINGIEGYPQFSHYATGSQLDDKSQYNL